MRTLFLKVVSLFVVLTLIINILPLNAFASTVTNVAANTQNENQTQNNAVLSAESIMSDDSLQMTDAFILYENEEKRSEFSKDFLLSNGLSLAAVYPYAVHFEEDGQWKEIDHTLTSVVERGTAVYKNKAGAWDVYFPQTLTSQNSVSVSKDGYKLSFGMAGELRVSNVPFVPGGAVIASIAGDTTAETFALSAAQNSIAQIQETNIQSVKQGSEFPETVCDKASSRLLYADVYSNTSIIYDLLGNQIKESIIIRSYDANLRGYRYALNTGSMIPVLQEDGSIVMYTPDRQEVVFTMPAPYMVDSNGEYSGDVDITLSGSGGNYTLTYILPTAWLAEEDRAWPVILDPIVNAESSTSNIADRTVAEERTLASNWGMNACGYRAGWGIHRFYMKFINLPALNSADDIISAKVTIYDQYDPDTYSIVEVHGVTETWTSSGMTWSNKPNHVDAVTDYVKVTAAGYYSFDVTDLAHGWYTGENTGMVFKMSDEVEQSGVDDWKQFYSCEFGAIKPTLQITYRNTNGIEAYWDYTTLPAGRAGEGYVQNYTGNLMWVHNDMGFAGNRMPVSISHIFSANDAWDYLNNTGYNPFGLGNGWRTNFNQTIEQATTSTGDIYYIWEDGDGTSHEFWLASNGQYTDNDDLGLTLTVTSDGYRISDKQENTSTFDAQGRLTRQSDNQNIASTDQNIKNEIKITYQSTTSKLISQIKDGVNRKYTFNYNNGLLEQISFYGTGSSVLSTIRFTYVNSNLATITYADGLKTQFVYTTKNMLSSVTNIDGYRVSLTYSSLDLKKPSKVTSIVDDYVKTTQTAQGGTTTFSYGHRYTAITKVSQNAGAEDVTYTHYFNEWGNTISIQDGEGNAVFYQYDTDISASGTKNRLQAASKEIGTTVNLLKDTSFEKGTLWAPSAGSTTSSISTAEKLDGSKSIKSTCSQEYGGVSGASCGTFTVAAGEAVTFSAYMKTIGGKARLRITDNNNLRIDSEWLDSNTDWTRLEVTYKNTSSAVRTITVSVCHVTPGSAYVDCVQLEKNQTASSYNMATDSDISSGVGGANSAWSRYSGNTTYPSVSSMDSVANLDQNVISIDGDLGVKKYAYQTITFPGKAGDRYILSGWTMGEALPSTHENFFYGLILVFNYTNGRQQEVRIHANPTLGNNGQWQYLAMPAIAEEDYSSITIRAENSYNDNVVYFDGLQLYKEEFGETYTYDSASGNLTVVRDASGLETKYSYYSNNDLKDVEQPSGVKVLYSDYSSHNPEKITTTAPDGDDRIVISTETYEYDTYGNVLKHTVTYGDVSKTTSALYTGSGNQLDSTTDELGKITRYGYDLNTGVLDWVQYPNDTATTRTNYVYDSMYRLVSTNMTNSDGKQLSATYTYDKDNITQVSTKSTVYNFVYGDFSLRSQVSIGSNLLTRYEYTDDENKNLSLLEYGNGHVVKYSYDDLGRLSQEQYLDENGTVVRTITYAYNNSGVLATMTDSKTGVTTKYHYDHAGRALGATETVNGKAHGIWYTYNELGQLKQMREVYGDTSVHTDYTYDVAGRIIEIESGNTNSKYSYDSFNRIAQQRALHGTTTVLIQDITYRSPASNSTSSQIIDWHCYNTNNFNLQFSYTYDANGNILSVTSQGKTTRYFYDSANQLIEERNAAAGKAWAWTYDDAGNITSRTERSYVNDSLGSIMNVTNYQYENGAWGDLLDTYGGVNIDHDAIGNLVDDGTWEYTWTQGRMLARMERKSNSSSYWEFTYDANGMRTKRHSSEGTYTYVYNGGLLSRMGYDGVELRFTYDASGKPLTVTYSGATYYYVLNLQGDVVAILNSSGTAVVTYTYDAWGIILDTTDSTATVTTGTGAKLGLGALNPLRYRGYVYDRETGLYYLQSRYYNPTWGRFISADNVMPDVGGDILGYNLFAYCMNNPVNYSDQGGNWPSWATKLLIGTAVIAAAAILTVATAGTGTALACFAVGALKGAAIGAAVGAASGAATGAVTHRITTGSWEGAGQAALDGAADGYMMGAITGFISGGLTSDVCFVAGTTVLASTGYVAIETIRAGDYVWASDPETGEVSLKQVVQTFVNEATELVHVTVNGEEIVCTTEHPFYSPVKGWIAACKLRAGDILVTVNGEYVVVEKVQHEILESPVKVYNFEVEGFHTYYVGNTTVLVHNLCRNSGGRHGGLAHRAKVSEVKASLTSKGWTVSGAESRIYVGGGKYRYPDIIATKNGVTRFYQIGRQTMAGKPIARELRALRDLGRTGITTFFIPYI